MDAEAAEAAMEGALRRRESLERARRNLEALGETCERHTQLHALLAKVMPYLTIRSDLGI